MKARPARKRLAVLVVQAAAALTTADAAAQDGPTEHDAEAMVVQVVATPCDGVTFDAEQVWQLVQVELASLGVRAERASADDVATPDAARPSAAVIAIECGDAPDTLALRIYDMVGARELRREVVLDEVAVPSRPRAVALAAVGLLESSWLALAADDDDSRGALPQPVRAALRERLVRKLELPASPEPAPRTSEPVEPPPEPPRFAAGAALRAFPGRSTALIGLAFTLAPSIDEHVRLALYAEALWSHGELSSPNEMTGAVDTIGTIDLYWLTAGLGVGWRTGTEPELELGPRLLAGYALADAHAVQDGASADDAGDPVAAALLVTTLRVRASDALHVVVEADLGYAPIGVSFVGDGSRLSGMADTTLALRFGLAW